MAEQIMWAVKGPDGRIRLEGFGSTEGEALYRFACAVYTVERAGWRDDLAGYGYRCIRVKVTEVGDA